MREGVDYSSARFTGPELLERGKTFAMRYLADDYRGITPGELMSLTAPGLDVGLVYEESATASRGGYAEGQAQGREIVRLLAKLGAPSRTVVYCAVDHDVTDDMGTAIAFVDGVASIRGADLTGVYGEFDVVNAAAGHCKYFWQTYAWSRGNKPRDHVHLFQYSNDEWSGAVDFTRALKDNFGQLGGSAQPGDRSDAYWFRQLV